MSVRLLRQILSGYFLVLFVICLIVRMTFSLTAPSEEQQRFVDSWWSDGKRINRELVLAKGRTAFMDADRRGMAGGGKLGRELIVGEAPILMHPLLFDLALVPGRDGVKAELGPDKVAYATADDLLSYQAYDKAHVHAEASFGWGTHRPTVLHILAEQLKVPPSELEARATFKRVRFERRESQLPPLFAFRPAGQIDRIPGKGPQKRPEHITDKDLTRDLLLDSLAEAAQHLARSVDDDGRYRYMIDAPSNLTFTGYNWPRHSGATFFLAQAASILEEDGKRNESEAERYRQRGYLWEGPEVFIRYACLRAASRLRDQMMRDCGAQRCIGQDDAIVEIGSSALALIAFTEIVRTGADGAYRPAIVELAAFLRSQQRPDGEFMHQFNRTTKTPIDVQFLYFSGEATLALARAHAITGDPRDLDAARRGLARLSGSGWSFFGSRYYFSEEHWTCQAVAELWERAPDQEALDFCSRWHEYQRRLQLREGDTPFDGDGAFSFGPLVSPRVTPASSRGEAAGALLDVLVREKHAGHLGRENERLLVENELDRSLAFVLRNQFVPGPEHLFANPFAVRGAVPGSPVDYQLRIDYAQHAGSMMARWLEVQALQKQREGVAKP